MLGPSLLVAPKILQAEETTEQKFLLWEKKTPPHHKIKVYLPLESLWYYYFSKQSIGDSAQPIDLEVPELEQGLFVRGGSILPVSLHANRLSVLRFKHRPIRLEVYPDRSGQAEGNLYLDDGETFRYSAEREYSKLRFSFKDRVLSYAIEDPESYYPNAFDQFISEVYVYGWN